MGRDQCARKVCFWVGIGRGTWAPRCSRGVPQHGFPGAERWPGWPSALFIHSIHLPIPSSPAPLPHHPPPLVTSFLLSSSRFPPSPSSPSSLHLPPPSLPPQSLFPVPAAHAPVIETCDSVTNLNCLITTYQALGITRKMSCFLTLSNINTASCVPCSWLP